MKDALQTRLNDISALQCTKCTLTHSRYTKDNLLYGEMYIVSDPVSPEFYCTRKNNVTDSTHFSTM